MTARDVLTKFNRDTDAAYSHVASERLADMQLEALAAAGYAVVPVEPTEAIAQAGEYASVQFCNPTPDFPGMTKYSRGQTVYPIISAEQAAIIYKAMIAKAQDTDR